MNIVVIGLGSMGKRRIRLSKTIEAIDTIIGVDSRKDRREEVSREFGIEVSDSISRNSVKKYDLESAFVCTSPLSHSDIITNCLNLGLNVFTEINLVNDGYDRNINLSIKKNKKLFLSSTFLYRKEIEYIIDSVYNHKGKLSYMYHVGQYLPSWHPWESFKDYFIGNKATNGIRELFAIELPWVVNCFGKVKSFNSISRKISNLSIDYDDYYSVIIEHETGTIGVITVDVVTPNGVRNLEIIGENLHVYWKGRPDTLKVSKGGPLEGIDLYDNVLRQDGYQATIIEDAYAEEIKEFIEVVNTNKKPRFSFEEDKEILFLIDEIGA